MSVDVCRGEADGQSEQLRSQRTLSAQRAEQLRAQLRDQPGDFGGNRGNAMECCTTAWHSTAMHGARMSWISHVDEQ
jgi:hypothetical protein